MADRPIRGRPRLLGAGAAALALMFAACGSDPALEGSRTAGRLVPSPVVVEIHDLEFDPAVVTVGVGQSVVWKWDDGVIPHNVVGPGFKSAAMATGEFRHRFTEPGPVQYTCRLHPTMKGLVRVVLVTVR